MNITAPRTGLWWRVTLVVLLTVVGVYSAIGCLLAWVLMGFMGTEYAPWEPIAWPLGAVASLLVPVIAGRWLVGRPGKTYWLAATGVVLVLVFAAVFVGRRLLGIG